MYDLKLNVIGQDVAVQLAFKDVIFVMEDVDAASDIVHRRDGDSVTRRPRRALVSLLASPRLLSPSPPPPPLSATNPYPEPSAQPEPVTPTGACDPNRSL